MMPVRVSPDSFWENISVTEPTPPNSNRKASDSNRSSVSPERSDPSESALQSEGLAPGADEAQAERALWVGRTHWKHYIGRLALWLLVIFAVAVAVGWAAESLDGLDWRGAFWIDAAVIGLTGIWVLGGVAWRILSCRYRLTSQRLFIEQGILSQTIDQTELVRVDDVRIRKSLTDRIFALGTVVVSSTDATDRQVTIVGIREPDRVAELIRANMRTMRRRSLYVENI